MCELAFSRYPEPNTVDDLRWESIDVSLWEQLGQYFECSYDGAEYSLYRINKIEILRLLVTTLACRGIMSFFDELLASYQEESKNPTDSDPINVSESQNLIESMQEHEHNNLAESESKHKNAPESVSEHKNTPESEHEHVEYHLKNQNLVTNPLSLISPTEAERHIAICHLLDVLVLMTTNCCNICDSNKKTLIYCYHQDPVGFDDYFTVNCCEHNDRDNENVYYLDYNVNLIRPNPFLIPLGCEHSIRRHLLDNVLTGPGLDDDDYDEGDEGDSDNDEGDSELCDGSDDENENAGVNYENCRFVDLNTYLSLFRVMPPVENVWCILKINKQIKSTE